MMREVLSLDRLRAMPPEDAAAIWALRRAEGVSPPEEAVFEEWLRLDEANVLAWEDARTAWSAFENTEDDEILRALREHARDSRGTSILRLPQFAAAAAVLMALVTGAVFLSDQPVSGERERDPITANAGAPEGAPQFVTAKGEVRSVRLPDGSEVTLDTESAVRLDFASSRRGLHLLKGRAFFAVSHNDKRPFAVTADGQQVTALGTRFDVRLERAGLRVVLVEGSVTVAPVGSAGPGVTLKPGEQLLHRAGRPPVVTGGRIEEVLNWQQGFATFEDDTLAAAAEELNRYSREKLIVRDPHVARLRISGMFRTGDPMRFGRALKEVHPVELQRVGADTVEIVSAR
jgi:transmembrane sensor